jgi:hypothetical protein
VSSFAALALMRSIMETMLRDDYNAQGNDLSERINSGSKILPQVQMRRRCIA